MFHAFSDVNRYVCYMLKALAHANIDIYEARRSVQTTEHSRLTLFGLIGLWILQTMSVESCRRQRVGEQSLPIAAF